MPNDQEMKTALRNGLRQNNLTLVRNAIADLKKNKTSRQVKTILSVTLYETPRNYVQFSGPN